MDLQVKLNLLQAQVEDTMETLGEVGNKDMLKLLAQLLVKEEVDYDIYETQLADVAKKVMMSNEYKPVIFTQLQRVLETAKEVMELQEKKKDEEIESFKHRTKELFCEIEDFCVDNELDLNLVLMEIAESLEK